MLLLSQVGIELVGAYFICVTLFKCVGYVLSPPRRERDARERQPSPRDREDESTPVAVVYLCAGDLDREALESLCRLRDPRLDVFVHDDSRDPEDNREVDRVVSELRRRIGTSITTLRRSEHTGGKAGAVNYVLQHIGSRYPYFLLCDSDSLVLDERVVEKALRLFDDPRVALHIQEGRNFVAASKDKYDLIEFSMIDLPLASLAFSPFSAWRK